MSSINLEIVFEGMAARDGTIDALLLAESLIGLSEVFTRASTILNGEESQAEVRVRSDFVRGSFVAHLQLIVNGVQQFSAQHLAQIIGFIETEVAKEVGKEVIKSALGLFKRLWHKKPDEIKKEDNEVEITSGGETATVNVNVYNLYGDSAIRLGLDRLTSPLREAEIDRIMLKEGEKEQTVFDKSDAKYFEAEPETEGEREAILVVSKLSFEEGGNWTFFERGGTVVAKIKDKEFWDKVNRHEMTFAKGDVFRVRLAWKILERNGGMKQKNIIVKVIEKVEHSKQLRHDTMKLFPNKRKIRSYEPLDKVNRSIDLRQEEPEE